MMTPDIVWLSVVFQKINELPTLKIRRVYIRTELFQPLYEMSGDLAIHMPAGNHQLVLGGHCPL